MNITNYKMVYMIIDIFNVYTIFKFMNIFFDRKKINKKREFILYFLYFILSNLIYLFVDIPMILMISNLCLFIIISLNYQAPMKKRIVAVGYIYLILMIIECIVGFLTGYLNFSVYGVSNYYNIIGLICVRIVSYILVLYCENYKDIKKGNQIPNSYWISIFLIPFISLYIIITLLQVSVLSTYQLVISISGILLINMISFYLYDVLNIKLEEKYEKALLSQQNEYYNKQFKIMKESLESTKSLKHDLKNHLSVLKIYLEENENNHALNYISQIIECSSIKKEYSNSGNIIIDSILNLKIQEAEKKGIKTSINLIIPEYLNIPSFDMSIILGNLLDNAITATCKLNCKRMIDIKIKYDKGRLLIKIQNTFNNQINSYNGKIITTNLDKENHGYGIKNINNVLEKYEGILDIKFEDGLFTTIVLMYLKNS